MATPAGPNLGDLGRTGGNSLALGNYGRLSGAAGPVVMALEFMLNVSRSRSFNLNVSRSKSFSLAVTTSVGKDLDI